ncbi:MAG: LPS export ABC transporter permease LptG [bacterium]
MKITDRYVLRSFLGVFLGSIFIVAFLFTALSVLDSMTYLMGKKGASFGEIVYFHLLQLPQTLYMTAPVAALISAMITMGTFNQRFEIMAVRAAGVSIARAAMPVLISSFFIFAGLFVLGNTLVPYGNRYFFNMEEKIKGKDKEEENRLWYVSEHRDTRYILRAGHLNRNTGHIKSLTVYHLDPDFQLVKQTLAKEAYYEPQKGWTMKNVVHRYFSGMDPPHTETAEQAMLDIPATKKDLLRVQRLPEEMTLSELNRQIKRIKKHGRSNAAYKVERQARVAIPFAAVILILAGTPLAIRPVRSSGLAVSILGAIIVGFVYYVIIAEFISLGKGGLVSPVVAAWSANVIFGVLGVVLFSGLRK